MIDPRLASGDFWAITAYFNPLGYRRRRENFVRFRAALPLPLVVAEQAAPGRFEIAADDRTQVLRLPGGDLMFQKEALLNAALRQVPPHVRHIAWLDCDVILVQQDWPDLARAALRLVPLVQLFTDCHDVPPCGTCDPLPGVTGRGIAALEHMAGRPVATDENEPARDKLRGLAWAARADLLRAQGFYDAMIIGGGDRAMEGPAFGRIAETCTMLALTEARRRHYVPWAERFQAAVGRQVGVLPSALLHLWHGDPQKRAYRQRHRRFAELEFDPARDLERTPHGLWRWARPRTDLAAFMADYFAARQEDG